MKIISNIINACNKLLRGNVINEDYIANAMPPQADNNYLTSEEINVNNKSLAIEICSRSSRFESLGYMSIDAVNVNDRTFERNKKGSISAPPTSPVGGFSHREKAAKMNELNRVRGERT